MQLKRFCTPRHARTCRRTFINAAGTSMQRVPDCEKYLDVLAVSSTLLISISNAILPSHTLTSFNLHQTSLICSTNPFRLAINIPSKNISTTPRLWGCRQIQNKRGGGTDTAVGTDNTVVVVVVVVLLVSGCTSNTVLMRDQQSGMHPNLSVLLFSH